MSAVINPRQIVKYQTDKVLLEFNDHMSVADPSYASNIHSQYSKINVVAIDYSQGKKEQSIVADLNIDPDVFKYLAEEILHGTRINFSEQKVLVHKTNPANATECKVTKFIINYNDKMRCPWNIVVENGWGIPETQKNGGVALQKGSYRQEKTVKVFINDTNMKRIMIVVRDYIRNFEITNFEALMKARQQYENNEV